MKTNTVGLITLKAKKVKVSEHGYVGYKTELYQDGKLKVTIPLLSKQPRKNSKIYVLNGWRFRLDWE